MKTIGPTAASSTASGARRTLGDAIILAGGVAKGAFAAGAVCALAESTPLRVRRIVATSAGALSAVFLASAIRDGRDLAVAAAELVALWRSKATVAGAFELSAGAIASRTGFSTSRKLLALMRQYVRPSRGRRPVELRLVVTNARGTSAHVGDRPATTFEHVVRFNGTAFDSEEGLERVFRAACASAAFPIAFQPVDVRIGAVDSPCFDGGLVDNAPIKLAVDDPYVSRVFLIAPYPLQYEPPAEFRGGPLLLHLADVLVQERLYRDLREAYATNDALLRIAALVPDPRARAVLLDAIGWRGRRPIEIVELRPPGALAGNAFDGLFRASLRDAYIEAGVEAAHSWIDEQHRALARSTG